MEKAEDLNRHKEKHQNMEPIIKYGSSLYLLGIVGLGSAYYFEMTPFLLRGIEYGYIFMILAWMYIYKKMVDVGIYNEFNTIMIALSFIMGLVYIFKLSPLALIWGSIVIISSFLILRYHLRNVYYGA